MTDRITHYYERLKDDGKIERAPVNDFDGKITGRIVFGVQAWFDENPEERKRLGWIKHITKDSKEIEYNHQTQYLTKATNIIDEYTVEDEYRVMDKSEEMMRQEETFGEKWYTDDSEQIILGVW